MPLQFHYPEFFLLLIPLALAFRRFGRGADRVTTALRLFIALLLLLALTGPEINLGGEGLDVIIVADRSRSMTDAAQANVLELIENLDRNRNPGDRVGIVTFGTQAEVERLPSHQALLRGFEKTVSSNGSDLNAALLMALSLVNENRPARILVLSDGESNGADPHSAARRARELGVPVDYRVYERIRGGDVAIEDLTLPRGIAPREPFQFTVRVFADRDAAASIKITRDGNVMATRDVKLLNGVNAVPFRDVLEAGGFYRYEAEIAVADDPVPENNRGLGVVRVHAGPKLLVLNADGKLSNLVRAIRAADIVVDVAAAKMHPLTQDALDPYRAVILENVPADELGRLKMERLAQYVEDLGGGLMLTGGENSFASGGYYKSPLEDVLPVSMELRDEHRKLRVAIAVVLDQSGSMTALVKGGQTKMDLANLGTSEVVRMLSPQDVVSVIAVTTEPHVIQESIQVEAPEAITARIMGIRSGSGGIYVYEALEAAYEQLEQVPEYQTRHVILFSDANDSDHPGEYRALLKTFAQENITVSVIGLGKETDQHGPLLVDVAKHGGGNVLFTEDPEELPRLFTQETLSVARGSFIKKDKSQPAGIPGELLSEQARLMGDLNFGQFPRADGYNLTYVKPHATAAAVSRDEYKAPWAAFWYRGLGRAAAITLEVDGIHTGEFGRWDYYDDFLITHARWLLGGNVLSDVYVDLHREGQEAVVTVELDPAHQTGLARKPPQLFVVPPGLEREEALAPDFEWTGPYVLKASFRLEQTGTYRTLVQSLNGELTRGPAVTLPYSPEFAPRRPTESGRRLLAELAELSGGQSRTDVLAILADPPRSASLKPLLPYLIMAALAVLLVEIAGRRLSWWKRSQPVFVAAAFGSDDPALDYRRRWYARRRKIPIQPSTSASAVNPPATDGRPSVDQIYERAKERARHRL